MSEMCIFLQVKLLVGIQLNSRSIRQGQCSDFVTAVPLGPRSLMYKNFKNTN